MIRKQSKAQKRSIVKGAMAGLVGGIAGSAAKALAEKSFSPGPEDRTAPSVAATVPWTFGAVAGALYGAAVELAPKAGAWRGAAFGLTLNKLAHEALTTKDGVPKVSVPETERAQPTVRQKTRARQREWVTFVVFGVVADTVRRLVRRGM